MTTVLWLIKLAVFFSASYMTSRILLNKIHKHNSSAAGSDPEIIAVSVISGAVVTGFIMFILKRLI